MDRKTPCENNSIELKEYIDKTVENKINQLAKSDTSNDLKFIDLCCGIGGFHQALSQLGMKCVLASDIDEDCRDNYEDNYNIKPEGDLRNIEIDSIPAFDILCAGFPCQPFSKAGSQKGFQDDRGNIFFDISKIIEYHKPKYVILENVRNLATHDKGNTWKVIQDKIEQLDYYTYDKPIILNTLYFGVPQSRERVVILCKRKDLGVLPQLPDISKKRIQKTSLDSIIEHNNQSNTLNEKSVATEHVWEAFLTILKQNNIPVPKYPIWTDWWDSDGNGTRVTKYDKKKTAEENKVIISKRQIDFYTKYKNWIDKNRSFYQQNKNILESWLINSRRNEKWKGAVRKLEWQAGDDNLTMKDVLWSPRGSGVRIKKTDYSPTLVAMASMIPIYGPLSREFTPRECARLQSFPDSYKIHPDKYIAYKQFGNAVNVNMIQQCANFLIYHKPLFN
jgi:DNA (cytosine-5)-methyltransferase 1